MFHHLCYDFKTKVAHYFNILKAINTIRELFANHGNVPFSEKCLNYDTF
jgi:hypothetical protein